MEEANNGHEIGGPRISSLNFSMKLVVCREKQIYTHLSSQAVIPGDYVGWQPCFLSSYRKVHSLSVGENVACHLQMGELCLAQSLASAIVLALGPTGHAMPKLGPGFRTPSE